VGLDPSADGSPVITPEPTIIERFPPEDIVVLIPPVTIENP
jgi:hypothetical protein